MNCERRILCPPGTGADSPGTNYSSERPGRPEFPGRHYPTGPYTTYDVMGCLGLCRSYLSIEDANLCAQKQALQCKKGSKDSPTKDHTYQNTPQQCTEPNTGKTVIVPAGAFTADSQAEADAKALAEANKQQKNGDGNTGVVITPPGNPTNPPVIIVNDIPTPHGGTKPKPKPNPASQCKPCDDTVGVDTFVFADGAAAGQGFIHIASLPLKCGVWKLEVNGGPYPNDTPPASIAVGIYACDSTDIDLQTPLSWSEFENCPQPAWNVPCGTGESCYPNTTQKFGFTPGCCDKTSSDCAYLHCAQLPSGNYLMSIHFWYVCTVPTPPARAFTITGTWVGPLPTIP